MDRQPIFTRPDEVLPDVERPFAILLDAGDRDWADDLNLVRLGRALLQAGCRYFVCFGPESEHIHDRIDDLIIEGGYQGIITTWHHDESEQDVAEFFGYAAGSGMTAAVVLVRDAERWSRAFSARGEE